MKPTHYVLHNGKRHEVSVDLERNYDCRGDAQAATYEARIVGELKSTLGLEPDSGPPYPPYTALGYTEIDALAALDYYVCWLREVEGEDIDLLDPIVLK